jgi:hypothetical protein
MWFGTKGKKYWTLFCGLAMGASFLAGGLYLENNRGASERESFIMKFVLTANHNIYSINPDGRFLCRSYFLRIREWC